MIKFNDFITVKDFTDLRQWHGRKIRDFSLVSYGDIVYDTQWKWLTEEKLSSIINPIILLTTQHDDEIEGDNVIKILNHPKILVWFGINAKIHHPKLILIPHGLDTGQNKEDITLNTNKNNLLYLNFTLHHNESREKAINYFSNKNFAKIDTYNTPIL